MADKFEATFHPGGEPLPRRDPFATLASFDRTARPAAPIEPPAIDSDEAYLSPGRPPWEPEKSPLWPYVAGIGLGIIGLVVLLILGIL